MIIPKSDKPEAMEVARAFFALAKKEGSPDFTAYKLQKLLYHAQAICQAERGRDLFQERVRAWRDGPVVANVFHETKGLRCIPYTHESLGKASVLPDEDLELVHAVWERFKRLSGDELSNRSHDDEAYKRARKRFGRNPVIDAGDMREDVTKRRAANERDFASFVAGLEAGE